MSNQTTTVGQKTKAGLGMSGIGLGIGGIIAFATTGSELGIAVSINNLVQGLLALWECVQERRSNRSSRVDIRLSGSAREFGFGPGNGAAGMLIAGMIAMAAMAPASACGTAFADGAATAGSCVARCALSCATSWVGDLVDLPEPGEQYAEGSRPALGSALQYLVEDDSGQKLAIMGRLESWPVSGGGGLLVGYMRLEDGTLLTVLLSPEPRLYHASTAFFDVPLAPPGFEPSAPPVGLQDYAARFGEPATW